MPTNPFTVSQELQVVAEHVRHTNPAAADRLLARAQRWARAPSWAALGGDDVAEDVMVYQLAGAMRPRR